ncbi:hypothetical protein HPB49_001409 [Dermacentor silvarum]|uniref:Uncharacterized protein n=1 Tax=Dermacentor silvarum TaxID=543639 RepID=A0ACB8CNY9_DERSI|nr:hypothetical protein HPB49_001409 [Dermacentor silvarum]
MTLFAIAVPYIGAAAKLFMSLYSSASGPFAGLVILAISSPWVNAKGAAWASLGVCALQLWHALGRGLTGVGRSSFIPGTLDRCSLDANDTAKGGISTVSVYQAVPTTSAYVLPLYRLSFFWIAFIGFLLTLLLGTIFSLATAEKVRAPSPRRESKFKKGSELSFSRSRMRSMGEYWAFKLARKRGASSIFKMQKQSSTYLWKAFGVGLNVSNAFPYKAPSTTLAVVTHIDDPIATPRVF